MIAKAIVNMTLMAMAFAMNWKFWDVRIIWLVIMYPMLPMRQVVFTHNFIILAMVYVFKTQMATVFAMR